MIILIAILSFLWLWLSVKTTSFILNDLMDSGGGKAAVCLAFLEGLIWPVTYFILMFFIVFGAIYGESISDSWRVIKKHWRVAK